MSSAGLTLQKRAYRWATMKEPFETDRKALEEAGLFFGGRLNDKARGMVSREMIERSAPLKGKQRLSNEELAVFRRQLAEAPPPDEEGTGHIILHVDRPFSWTIKLNNTPWAIAQFKRMVGLTGGI